MRNGHFSLSVLSLCCMAACSSTPREKDSTQGAIPPAVASPAAEQAPIDADGPQDLWPTIATPFRLTAGTMLSVRETRRVEGVETQESIVRVRWTEVDTDGRGQRAEVVVQREVRGIEGALNPTPNEGLRFHIAPRNGHLRLLAGNEPDFRDETERQPALFARVLGSGGHSALRPETPTAIGAQWSVPLGKYIAEAGLANAPAFEGRINARRAPDRDQSIEVHFDVALKTPERFQRDASLNLTGSVLFDRQLGIAIKKQTEGVLREGRTNYRIEVETVIEDISLGSETPDRPR